MHIASGMALLILSLCCAALAVAFARDYGHLTRTIMGWYTASTAGRTLARGRKLELEPKRQLAETILRVAYTVFFAMFCLVLLIAAVARLS